MYYNQLRTSMKLVSTRVNPVESHMNSNPDLNEYKIKFGHNSSNIQWVAFLLTLGMPVKPKCDREKDACYQVINGFFSKTLIFISMREGYLKVVFKVNNYEQGNILQKLSAGIEKRLSSGLLGCKIEVIFENRRL